MIRRVLIPSDSTLPLAVGTYGTHASRSMMTPSHGFRAGHCSGRGGRNNGRRARRSRGLAFCLLLVQTSGFVCKKPVPRLPPQRHPTRTAGSTTDGNFGECSKLVALEFYSGVGGLRVSLEKAVEANGKAAGDATVDRSAVPKTTSYEINSVANSVYEHNFPGCSVTRRSIEHLSAEDIDGVGDIWLLSPPCQPFCRVGNKMDDQDPRTASFLHLLLLLKTAEKPPSHLFLENVYGFDGSHTHRRFLEVLTDRGFDVEQYLLSPVQLGIPNTRRRYYCLASRRNADGEGKVSAIEESIPPISSLLQQDEATLPVRPLSDFLEPSLDGNAAVPLLLSPKAASHANSSLRFDVVTTLSTETTTFTKGYGKHAGRAGPVLLLTDDGKRRVSEQKLERFPSGLDFGPGGREIRWFSDREMLRLHGFPEWFGFPPGLTQRQRFALLGNSVNVEMVSLLLRRMLFPTKNFGEGGEVEFDNLVTPPPGPTRGKEL